MRSPNTLSTRCCRVALWAILLAFLVLPILGSQPAQAAKPTKTPKAGGGSSPSEVLNLVNQLRAAKGLAPLKSNAALMSSAQAHSNYQASVHSITHYGPGGNSAKDRALAAGYGGGAAFSLSENIYGGTNATAQYAVTWWKGDAPHLNTMLGANYTDAGVGVATDGSLVYYTLDVGYVYGTPGSGGTGGTGAATPLAGTTTPVAVNPVDMATPMPDGSIVHTVKSGQTLWTIAAIYKVDLQELLKLNSFTENTMIYIGQKVLVKGPSAPPTPAPSETNTPTSTLKPTPIPSRTHEQPATAVGQVQPTDDSDRPDKQNSIAGLGIDPILIIIGALVAGGLVLVVAGSLLNRRGVAK